MLMTEQEAAKRLCLSTKTLQKNRWLGKGPKYLKLGKSVRYDLSDIEEYLALCRVTPHGEAA